MKSHFRKPYTVVALLLVVVGIAQSQSLKADYQFQESLDSSLPGAPAMTNLACAGASNGFDLDKIDGYNRPTLRFEQNCGLAVATNGVIPNSSYTVVILFRFEDVSGFRRVVSFDNGVSDNGAYILDGRLENESLANAPFLSGTYIQVAIVREATGNVRAYREGSLRVNAPDGGTFQIGPANTLRFFQDDANPPMEALRGRVARIRLYDGPMSTAQIRALDRLPNANGGGDQSIVYWSQLHGFAELFSMNVDGSNQRRLTNNEISEFAPRWSPRKDKIVYSRQDTSNSPVQVWSMNADGSGQTRLTNTTTNDRWPSWRPDGQKILFTRCDVSCDIFTMNPDGTDQTPFPLVNTGGTESDAEYSRDGTKIVYMCGSSSGTSYNICTATASGTNIQNLTSTVAPISNRVPRFSPDGTKIAMDRATNESNSATQDVFTMSSNGANLTNVSNLTGFDGNPAWSPAGNEIVFATTRDAGQEIYITTENGNFHTRLTTNSAPDGQPDWYVPKYVLFDYDGDGKSDLSVRRPTDNIWYLLQGTAGYTAQQFGEAGDRIAPADYDGDGKTDVAVFRPSTGTWFVFASQSQTFQQFGWGANGDLPVPTDRDNDGKADLVVYRESNNTWYTRYANGTFNTTQFGVAGDKPLVGDFDADGIGDIALFRPSNNNWYILKSSLGFFIQTWGEAGDIPVPADFDGDGATDQGVFRPSTGQWFLSRTTDGFGSQNWGQAGDIPVAADYDGDGKADVAIFRPTNGTWYIVNSSTGQLIQQFGQPGDVPTQSAYLY